MQFLQSMLVQELVWPFSGEDSSRVLQGFLGSEFQRMYTNGVCMQTIRNIIMNISCSKSDARKSAFTLIEMVVVLAILASVVSFAWPSVRRQLDKSQLRGAAKQLQAGLAKTRLKAIETGTPQLLQFTPGKSRYKVTSQNGPPIQIVAS